MRTKAQGTGAARDTIGALYSPCSGCRCLYEETPDAREEQWVSGEIDRMVGDAHVLTNRKDVGAVWADHGSLCYMDLCERGEWARKKGKSGNEIERR